MIRLINTFRNSNLSTQGFISAIALLAYFVSSYFLEQSYIKSKFPVPYFEQQTSFDAEKMKAWYAHMIGEGTFDIYFNTQLIDFVFILCVIVAGFSVWTFVASLYKQDTFFNKWGYKLAFALPLAAAFDILENLISFFMIADPQGFADSLMMPYSGFACIKFAFWMIGLLWVIIALLGFVISRLVGFKKLAVSCFCVLCLATVASAQTSNDNNSFEALIYVEADPLAFINKGYSIHLGYENWGFRFDLTKVKVDFPESFEDAFYGTKSFDLITNIHGVKIDYLGNRSNWTKGAFVGLDLNTQRLNFSHRTTDSMKDMQTINLGLRAGYKVDLFNGFYVTPWAATWKNIAKSDSFTVGDDTVSTNEWDWILTFHIGYAIKL